MIKIGNTAIESLSMSRRHKPLRKYHYLSGFIYSITYVSTNVCKVILHGMESLSIDEVTLCNGPIKCYIQGCSNTSNNGAFIILKVSNRAIYITNNNRSSDTDDETFATAPTSGDDTFSIGLIDISTSGFRTEGAFYPIYTEDSPHSISKNLEDEDIEYVYNTPGNFYFEVGTDPVWIQILPKTGSATVEVNYSIDGLFYTPNGVWQLLSASGSTFTGSSVIIDSSSGPIMFVLNKDNIRPGIWIKIRVHTLTSCEYSVCVL